MTVTRIRNKAPVERARQPAGAWPIGALRYLVAAVFTGFCCFRFMSL